MKSKILNLSIKLSILTVMLSLLMLGCTNPDDTATESSTGNLKVRMTDAPFPSDLVAEANVTISKIEIRQSGEAEASAFITLSEEEISLNLLELTNGVTASLADVDIEVGTYDMLRLYVSDASVVLKNETTFDLKIPSGAQSGIKIFVDPAIQVAGGASTELLLDFDVSQSFVAQGSVNSSAGIQGFIFTPVIKAANLSAAGRLEGTVTDSLDVAVEGAQISVFAADTLNTTSFTEANGSYAILGLASGSYNLVVEYGDYEAETAEDIEIEAGATTTHNVKLGSDQD